MSRSSDRVVKPRPGVRAKSLCVNARTVRPAVGGAAGAPALLLLICIIQDGGLFMVASLARTSAVFCPCHGLVEKHERTYFTHPSVGTLACGYWCFSTQP